MSDPRPCQVLLVDPSADNREVLRTALRRRGIVTWDTNQPQTGLAWARQHAPDVIVLDGKLCDHDPRLWAEYEAALAQSSARMLVLGRVSREDRAGHPAATTIAKPYHYGPLIRRIEDIVAAQGDAAERIGPHIR